MDAQTTLETEGCWLVCPACGTCPTIPGKMSDLICGCARLGMLTGWDAAARGTEGYVVSRKLESIIFRPSTAKRRGILLDVRTGMLHFFDLDTKSTPIPEGEREGAVLEAVRMAAVADVMDS